MKTYFLLIATALFVVSCSDLTDLEFEESLRTWAAPIAESETTFEDFFNDAPGATSVYIDENNIAIIRYDAKPVRRYAGAIIDPIDLNIPIALPNNPTVLPLPVPSEVELERAVLTGEKLFITYESDATEDVAIAISIPELSLNGATLVLRDTLRYDGTSPMVGGILDFDLAGYTLAIPEGTIEIGYSATLADGADVDLTRVIFLISKRLDFSYLEGIWSKNTFAGGSDTIRISLYEDFLSGSLEIDNPRIVARFSNSFGVPVEGRLPIFQVVTVDGTEVPITSPLLAEGIDFPFPGLSEDFNDIKDTTIVYDKSNSNLVEVFNSQPVRVEYQLDLVVNPDDLPDVRGWIADSSLLGVDVAVEIPVQGTADQFGAETQIEIGVEVNPDERPTKVELHFFSENEIPLGIEGQIYINAQGRIIDSLFTEKTEIVSAAIVDASGTVTEVAEKKTIVELSGTKLDRFLSANILTAKVQFSTSQEATVPVTVFGDQKLKINLGTLITERN